MCKCRGYVAVPYSEVHEHLPRRTTSWVFLFPLSLSIQLWGAGRHTTKVATPKELLKSQWRTL